MPTEPRCAVCGATDDECMATDGGCCDACRSSGGCSHPSEPPAPQARPVEQEIADVLAEHDWRWATRDSKTGTGVRIACTATDCEWTAERLDDNDNVWDRHRAHVAAAIAPIIALERAAAAQEALTEATDAVARREDEALITALLAMKCNEPARMVADWIEEMLRARADRIGGDPT